MVIVSYPNGLREQHPDHVLHPAWQREFINLAPIADDPVDLEPAQQLQRGHLARHPAHVDLVSGGHEQPLVVVTPRDGRDWTLE